MPSQHCRNPYKVSKISRCGTPNGVLDCAGLRLQTLALLHSLSVSTGGHTGLHPPPPLLHRPNKNGLIPEVEDDIHGLHSQLRLNRIKCRRGRFVTLGGTLRSCFLFFCVCVCSRMIAMVVPPDSLAEHTGRVRSSRLRVNRLGLAPR